MKTIAIFNQKGGVGKTTLTANLAGYFDKLYHKKVLVIDGDAQGNVSSYLTGIGVLNEKYTITNTISSLFNNPSPEQIVECIYPVFQPKLRKTILTNISVLPSDENLDNINVDNLFAIKNITDDLEKSFDICLIDCPPQKTQSSLCALAASDYVLVPIQLDGDSVKGMKMVMDLVDYMVDNDINPNLKILGFVVNQYSKAGALDNYLLNELKETYGDYIFDALLPYTRENKNAKHFAILLSYYKKSMGQKEYAHLAKEIIKRIKKGV